MAQSSTREASLYIFPDLIRQLGERQLRRHGITYMNWPIKIGSTAISRTTREGS